MKVRTNGIEVFVRERGAGAFALIFLHYWGGSSRTWSKVIDALPQTYRSIAPDFRGWGGSDAPRRGYALADMADDIEGLIDALQVERYILIGHSMGGKVALLLSSRNPRGLMGLVLVAPAPPPPLGIPAEARAMMATAYMSPAAVGAVIDQTLAGKALSASDRAQVIADSLRAAPQAQVAWPSASGLEDISREVTRIVVPSVVIAGEVDKVETVDWLKSAMMPCLPQAAFHVLPATGHLAPLESPKEIADIIQKFVARVIGNGSA